MSDIDLKKLMTGQAIIWAIAIITPAIVMVILDLFDKHTPSNIVIFTLACQLPLFGCSQNHLRNKLAGQAKGEES